MDTPIYNLINDMILAFRKKGRLNHKPTDCYISAPAFIIEMFGHDISRTYHAFFDPVPGTDKFKYQGFEFIYSPNMEIAIFHKNYPLYQEDSMIVKAVLASPVSKDIPTGGEGLVDVRPLLERYGYRKQPDANSSGFRTFPTNGFI